MGAIQSWDFGPCPAGFGSTEEPCGAGTFSPALLRPATWRDVLGRLTISLILVGLGTGEQGANAKLAFLDCVS